MTQQDKSLRRKCNNGGDKEVKEMPLTLESYQSYGAVYLLHHRAAQVTLLEAPAHLRDRGATFRRQDPSQRSLQLSSQRPAAVGTLVKRHQRGNHIRTLLPDRRLTNGGRPDYHSAVASNLSVTKGRERNQPLLSLVGTMPIALVSSVVPSTADTVTLLSIPRAGISIDERLVD
jgi:hypothetical protein